MFGGVHFSDYQAAGYSPVANQQAEEMHKALSAVSSVNPPGSIIPGDGFALRTESLEATLRTTAFKMRDLKLFKMLTGIPAFNTIEEFNLIREYGQAGIPGFFTEGGLPSETDSTYERKQIAMKYLGTTRRVTHPMMMVRAAHGDVVATETINGSLYLLRVIEKALFKADSSVLPVEFDGLEKQIRDGAPTAVIDLRGAPLTEDALTDGARQVSDAPNFGTPTDLHLSPTAQADVMKQFYPRQRIDLPNPQNGLVGLTASGIQTQAGPVRFQSNPFVDDGGLAGNAAGDPARQPLAPIQAVAPAAAGSAAPLWTARDAGTYIYQAVAVNDYGRSDPVTLTGVTVAATNTVTFTLQAAGGGRQTRGYEIYRTQAGGAASTARLIQRIPANASGLTVVTDLNAKLPGTTEAYMLQMDTENLAVKQLAAMLRIPLALLDASLRWMQVAYMALAMYTPQKNVLFVNVGRAAGSL